MLISNGDDMKKHEFKDRAKVEWFKVLAKNCCGTGKFKVRIKEYQDT